MKFKKTKLEGAYVIELEKQEDERGFFARVWNKKQFENMGLSYEIQQCSISFNKKKGTIRGMHYQEPPYEEVKLVRCTKGKIFDVIIDLRKNSTTFRKWICVELSAENHKIIYVPEGFAHGFQTLEDDSEVFYMISQIYRPEYAKGVRWNDPVFKIKWPLEKTVISDKNHSFIDFKD